MKKLIMIVMCAVVLLSACNNETIREIEENKVFNIDSGSKLVDMAIGSDGSIYVAEQKVVQILNSEGERKSTIDKGFTDIRAISAEGNTLYVLDGFINNVVKTFTLEGKFLKEYKINLKNCTQMECFNDKIVLLGGDEHEQNLIQYDCKTNQLTDIDFKGVYTLGYYSENIILMALLPKSTREAFKIIAYDLIKKKIVLEDYSNDEPYTLTYNNKDNTLYYTNSGKVYRLDTKTHAASTVYSKPGSQYINSIVAYDLYCFILDGKERKIYRIDKDNLLEGRKQDNKNILTVLQLEDEVERKNAVHRAIELMQNKYEDFQVKFRSISINGYGEYERILDTKLMAGDADFDIFYLGQTGSPMKYMKNETALDLTVYESIQKGFTGMFDGIKDMCSYHGNIKSVPLMINPFTWSMNTQLFDKLKLDYPPVGWTWEDFYEYAKKVKQDINGDGKTDVYAFEDSKIGGELLYQCRLAYLDPDKNVSSFNNEEFINVLRIWKRMFDEDLIHEDASDEQPESGVNDSILFKLDILSMIQGNGYHTQPPTLNSWRTYHTALDMLFINKHTKKIQLSVDFLASTLSRDAQKWSAGESLYKDISIYEEKGEFGEPLFKLRPGSHNFTVFEDVTAHSCTPANILDLDLYMCEVMKKFMDGTITEGETAELIDEKARMILKE